MKWTFPLALLLLGACDSANPPSGTKSDPLREEASALFAPLPERAPLAEEATDAEIALGRMLYLDPRLSLSQGISCNSCHNIGLGGADLQQFSIGHGWAFGGRNAPTTFNAVFHIAQFWDGRAADLAEQAAGPMANPVEMGNTHDRMITTLASIPDYAPLFAAAYPDAAEPLSLESAKRAIAAFEATLITPGAPFDRWLSGEDGALTERQKQGLRLFIDTGCTACHSGALFGGDSYQVFGAAEQPDETILPRADKGRMAVTGDPADEYVFKVPSLRNVALTRPYFHSGAVWSLREAVQVMGKAQLGADLDDSDAGLIAEFLESLTGQQPKIVYPALPMSTDGSVRPDPKANLESKGGH
ncbi:MAG: cytochrome-c peroxidase [Rhodothalassiaceae bacterium]